MKSWVPWVIVGAAAGMAYMGQPLFAAFIVLAGILGALVASMAHTRKRYEADPLEGLTLDSQSRLRPLVKARDELSLVADQNRSHPVISVIGAEAVVEADDLISKSADLLRARTELLKGGSKIDPERLEQLKAQREIATDLMEQERLDAAISASLSLEGHEEKRKEALAKIDSQIEEARLGIEELRAQLVSSLSPSPEAEDDLRSRLIQLKSLGASLDEANALLKDERM